MKLIYIQTSMSYLMDRDIPENYKKIVAQPINISLVQENNNTLLLDFHRPTELRYEKIR